MAAPQFSAVAPVTPDAKTRKPRPVAAPRELLPPQVDVPLGDTAIGGADDLLPVSADDGLLPQAAAAGPMASEPVPLPSLEPPTAPTTPTGNAMPALSLTVKDQRARKVLRVDGEDIVLRQLTPEERARRRFRWNVFLFGACMAVMGLVVWWGLRK